MDNWIQAYADGYAKIVRAIEGLSEEQLTFKPAPDKWSVKEIVIHLADTEVVLVHRLKSVIAEDRPALTAFDQDDWANRLRYVDQDHREHLALFKLLRESMVPVLKRLGADDWQRVGVHSHQGEVTLRDLLISYTKHVDKHIGQIERVKAAYAAK